MVNVRNLNRLEASATLNNWAEGRYNVTATAHDSYNTESWARYSFVLDRTGPSVDISVLRDVSPPPTTPSGSSRASEPQVSAVREKGMRHFFCAWRSDPCLNPDLEDLGEILRIMMRGDCLEKEGVEGITSAIIGAGMRVHSVLGSGFQEVIYQRALEIEFLKLGIGHEREKNMEIMYEGQRIGRRRVDFYVGEAVMVELKAVIR